MTITFRDALPGEPEAAALLDAYFDDREQTWSNPGAAYARKPAADEELTPPRGVLLLGYLDGAPAAIGGVRRIPGGEGVRFEIKHLFALPAARGTGLGRAMLAELERRAAGFGATEIVLDTNRSLVAAARLYAAAGYVSVAPFNDNPNATDWYAKALPARPPSL